MKKVIFFILLIAETSILYSQDFSITVGKSEPSRASITAYILLGKNSTGIFTVEDYQKLAGKLYYKLRKFDTNTLIQQKEVKIGLKVEDKDNGSGKLTVNSVRIVKDGVWIFGVKYYKKKKIKVLYAQKYDGDLNIEVTWKEVARIEMHNKLSNEFEIFNSEDNSKFMIANMLDLKRRKQEKLTYAVFNENMEPLSKYEILVPESDNYTNVSGCRVDNNGNLYFMYQVLKKNKYNFIIERYYQNEQKDADRETFFLDIPDYNFNQIIMDIDEHNNIYVVGFCNKGSILPNIAFHFYLTKGDYQPEATLTELKSEKFYYYSDGQTIKSESTNAYISPYLKLKKIILRKDGTCTLIGEVIAPDMPNTLREQDVVIMNFNESGEVECFTNFKKMTHTHIYSSYGLYETNNRSAVFYYDNPKNYDGKHKDYVIPNFTVNSNPVLVKSSLNKHSKIAVEVMNLEEMKSYRLMPKTMIQISEKEILVLTSNWFSIKLIKLTLN